MARARWANWAWWARWAGGAACLAAAVGPAWGDDVAATIRHPLKPAPTPGPAATLRAPCPPATIGPSLPGEQLPPPKSSDPGPVLPPVDVAPQADPLARSPEPGAQPSATLNPNMFGDLFGSRRLQYTRTISSARRLDYVLEGPLVSNGGIVGTTQVFPRVVYSAQAGTGGSITLVPSTLQPGTFVIDNGGSIRVNSPTFVPVGPVGPNSVPVNESNAISAAVRLLNPNASVIFLNGLAFQPNDPNSNAIFVRQSYDIRNTSTIVDAIDLVSPSAGGVVGRTKVAEDNYPLPRDRVFLGADWFANTVLSRDGIDVARFAPGAEWTFLDQRMSIEARLPFASTLDSVVGSDGLAGRALALGNLHLTLKALAYRGPTWNVAVGLGVGVPTGPDSIVRDGSGAELLRLANDSWTLTPYVAALWTPDDRWFAQGWLQLGIDPTGNRTFIDGNLAGRIYDQSLFQSDLQLGYWLIRNDATSTLRGLAPFVELHYNAPISDSRGLSTGGNVITSTDNRFTDLSMTVGATAQVGSNTLVSAGLVLPLRPKAERQFDYQLGLRASWFFGPTADRPLNFPPRDAGTVGETASDTMPPTGIESTTADLLARAPEPGAQPSTTLNPGMFGDFAGLLARTRQGNTPISTVYQGIKVADLGGPRPMDRLWFGSNRYSEIGGTSGRLLRHTLGGEMTVGDRFGIGARLPFTDFSLSGNGRELGDLTLVGKYTLLADPDSTDMIGIGSALTIPTGDRPAGLPEAVIVQPWLGSTLSWNSFFVQTMLSVALPSDPTYPVALFRSVSLGYWAYRNPGDVLVKGIAPVVELHGSVPLTNRRGNAPTFFDDQLNMTIGCYIHLTRLTVGAAYSLPLLAPRPYRGEAIVSISYQF